MLKIAQSVEDLIGKTPLLQLSRLKMKEGFQGNVFAKLEMRNPAGSVKDRVAKAMLDEAERSGKIKPGSVIIEPTSGNTGIGLCALCAARGYRAIIVMPESMSMERRMLMSLYGAEVVLTETSKGMAGAIEKANELVKEIPNSFLPGQFDNPANPAAHLATTGPEIWEDLEGNIDVFVAGVGTGGTLSGTAAYLKMQNPEIHVVAVEPASSAVLSGEKAGAHAIQGIGAGFVPGVLDTDIFDEIVTVQNEDAYAMLKNLAVSEGILAGISSGAALAAAIALAKDSRFEGKNIVVILPDTGERYLSSLASQNT